MYAYLERRAVLVRRLRNLRGVVVADVRVERRDEHERLAHYLQNLKVRNNYLEIVRDYFFKQLSLLPVLPNPSAYLAYFLVHGANLQINK